MDFVDRILELLMDSTWHNIEELEKKISLPGNKLYYALGFLNENAFVNIQNDRIIITNRGLRLMEL